MNNAEVCEAILGRKEVGCDCSEEESAQLKHYVRHGEDQTLMRRIVSAFPVEYAEALDEMSR